MKRKKLLKDILEIVLAFAAAWLFYQGLAFATGTSTPIVSVASESMFHAKGFGEWWSDRAGYYESIGISKDEFARFTNRHGLDKGDILFVIRADNLKAGDIIIYQPERGCFQIQETIVHRIVSIEDGQFITKGDNNPTQDRCTVKPQQIEGKTVFAVPLLGYPRLAIEPILQKVFPRKSYAQTSK